MLTLHGGPLNNNNNINKNNRLCFLASTWYLQATVCAPEKGEKRIGEERGLWLRSCAGYRFTAQTGAASRSLGTSQAFDASSEGTTKVRTCQEAKTEITRNRFLVDFFFFPPVQV